MFYVNMPESRGSTPLKTMGTLDDIDRDYSKLVPQTPEDELLDLHGNEEKATPLPVHSDHLVTLFPPYQVEFICITGRQESYVCTKYPFSYVPYLHY